MNPLYHNLDQVRSDIDQVDQQIVALLAQRQQLVDKAVAFKSTREEAEDPARVEAVITKVSAYAREKGLDADIAASVYRVMISEFIQRERKKILNNT